MEFTVSQGRNGYGIRVLYRSIHMPMKTTSSKSKLPFGAKLAGTGAVLVGLLCLPAFAGSVSFSTSAPTPGASDVYSFTAGATDADNILAGDDAATYVAFDRGAQGQTFLSPSGSPAYALAAVWLQWVNYDGTYVYLPPGGQFQVRLTDPSAAGGAGFVLHSELFPTTGSEANTLPTTFMGPITGAGTWVEFVLGTPVVLNPNTTYGFDVSSPNSFGAFDVQPFFETAGTSSDPFPSGAAYSSGPNGSGGDNTMTAQIGDRAFLLQLTGVPEPSALALIGLGGLAFLLRRRS